MKYREFGDKGAMKRQSKGNLTRGAFGKCGRKGHFHKDMKVIKKSERKNA